MIRTITDPAELDLLPESHIIIGGKPYNLILRDLHIAHLRLLAIAAVAGVVLGLPVGVATAYLMGVLPW